jgi:hypothetical protein
MALKQNLQAEASANRRAADITQLTRAQHGARGLSSRVSTALPVDHDLCHRTDDATLSYRLTL